MRRYKTRKHEDFGLGNNYLALPSLDIGKDLILLFHIGALQCLFVLGRDGTGILGCFLLVFFDLLFLKKQEECW